MKANKLITSIAGICMFLTLIISCNDSLDGANYFTTDEMTITETLEANPEKFSMYVEILKKTDFYSSFRSYGNYTCFAPINSALKTFLLEKFNVNSVSELTTKEQIDFLKTLVKFHTIPSSRTTSGFIEGRLADTTYTGDYLTTSFLLGGGIANVQINREVKLDVYDISANNGTIQALNGVLSPYIDGVPKVMEKAGKHTIFVEALKKTGYYDTFSVIYSQSGSKNNFTVLAESDAIYKKEGINSFAELAARFSPGKTDYTNPENDLNRFIAYHATQNFLYSSNFPADAFINTILPKNAIKSYKTDKVLKLNESETGVDDTWTSLIIPESNYPAKNGVYHTVDKLFTIFVPKAKHILFDFVSDQPEVQSKLVKTNTTYPSTAYEFVRWFPEVDRRFLQASGNMNLNNNIFDVGNYSWVEFDTPVIPKGKYELLISANGGNSARGVFQIYWDGEPIGSAWDLTLKGTTAGTGFPDEVLMESKGWRLGLPQITNNTTATTGATGATTAAASRFIITKELLCPEQSRHVLRIETIKAGGSPLDYLEFIPVN